MTGTGHAHQREEECLFFVAASRARTHLRLYLSTLQTNGKHRNASSFINWMPGGLIDDMSVPCTQPLPALSSRSAGYVEVVWPISWSITHSRLRLYEQCPRRFFYSHVLGLATARTSTAYSRTHDCIYAFIRWLADAAENNGVTEQSAVQQFEKIWIGTGPVDHPYADEYRQIADRFVRSMLIHSAGDRLRKSGCLPIDFVRAQVIVEPSGMSELSDGTAVLRLIRTGSKRSNEYDRLEYRLYHLAGQQHFGTRFRVEALHLADDLVEPVVVTSQKIENGRKQGEAMLTEIASGHFPAETNPTVCPRCPHFFICAATPTGVLELS